jgi:multiple sugar transport system ATP-binding protein
MSEIVVKNLKVTYQLNKKQTVDAIKNLNAIFEDGKFNVIIGFSGCGKSTLLKTLLGLLPFEGEISLDGVDINDYSIGERNFAYVSQDIVLQPHVTIFDNIAYPLRIRGMEKSLIVEKVNELAKELKISECLSRKPKHISIGQAQRAAIARALVKNASFYFFDEPFSNLDQENRDSGRFLLLEIMRKYHSSVIYVTHSIREATALADKIYVMDDGHFIFSGTPEELYECDDDRVKSLIEADKNE